MPDPVDIIMPREDLEGLCHCMKMLLIYEIARMRVITNPVEQQEQLGALHNMTLLLTKLEFALGEELPEATALGGERNDN